MPKLRLTFNRANLKNKLEKQTIHDKYKYNLKLRRAIVTIIQIIMTTSYYEIIISSTK